MENLKIAVVSMKTCGMTSHITIIALAMGASLLRTCCNKSLYSGLFFDLRRILGLPETVFSHANPVLQLA
jgi:hypothetical protein